MATIGHLQTPRVLGQRKMRRYYGNKATFANSLSPWTKDVNEKLLWQQVDGNIVYHSNQNANEMFAFEVWRKVELVVPCQKTLSIFTSINASLYWHSQVNT